LRLVIISAVFGAQDLSRKKRLNQRTGSYSSFVLYTSFQLFV